MRIFPLLGAAAWLLGSSAVWGQGVVSPGQLANITAASRTNFDTAGVGSGGVSTPSLAKIDDSHDRHMQTLWIVSIGTMLASTAADGYSSWHKHESNALLASSNGTFGGQGLAIKGAIAAGSLLPQIIFRKHKDWRTAFSVSNFAQTGIFTGATIHNLQVK